MASPVLAQRRCPAPCLIPPEFLAPQYVAPEDASSTVVIAREDEPGDRLVVTGRTLDGSKAVAGVSLFVFHTDANGVYAPGMNNIEGEFQPRLHGALRTDVNGRYRYETSRPGSYWDAPTHVHYVVKAPGYRPRLFTLQFEDDPIVVQQRKANKPQTIPPCRPDCLATRPVRRDTQGVAHVTYDIQRKKE